MPSYKPKFLFCTSLALILASCGAPSSSENSESSTAEESSSVSSFSSSESKELHFPEYITSLPLPRSYTSPVENKGQVETFSYKTKIYDINGNGTGEVEKKADVYLPYGYDEQKQYNILYLMHGGGEAYTYWLTEEKQTRDMLDNMFEYEDAEPCIVVAPSFYTGQGSDSMSELATDVFQYEFRNDLVPNLEKKYATYASGDTSVEGLRATRDHRAFAGLSMGSMVSIRSILLGCLDIVAYINSMSGGYAANTTDTQMAFGKIEHAVKETYKDYPVKFWFNHNGANDMALGPHKQLKDMILADLSDVFVEEVNYKWIEFPTGSHSYPSWITGLYNCLLVFFTR